MELTLANLVEAAQKAGTDGKAATPEQRAEAINKLIAEANLSRADVDALQNEALEEFQALDEKNPTAPADVLGVVILTEVAEAAREVQVSLDTQAEEQAAQLAALRDRMNAATESAAAEDGSGEGDEGGDEAGEGGEDTSTDAATDEGGEDAGAEQVSEAEPEPILASGAEPTVHFTIGAAARKKAPKPAPKDRDKAPGLTMVAAADVKGFSTGEGLSNIARLAEAAQAKIDAMPRGVPNATATAGIATIRFPYAKELNAARQGADHQAVLDAAVDQSRLKNRRTGKGGNLVAAGGWCSPSETLYDLTPLLADASAGLVDVPDIAVNRGGIRTTEGANFRTIYAGNVGLIQTETQAEAGTEKSLYRVPCTGFTETRADVVYTGIEAGILQNDAYPELTRQHVEGALAAHAHKINASTIKRMFDLSIDADMRKIGASAATSLLNGIELLIMDYRYGYRANESLFLEVELPIWLKTVLRSDLALRTGVDYIQITDQQIDALFLQRGARVQWLYDWQDAYTGVTGGFGSIDPIEEFPTEVTVMIYAAGTFVRGRGEVISLDAVYDSVNIKKNDYLQMFVEEKLLVRKRRYHSIRATFPLSVSGVTGAGRILDSNGAIVAAIGEDETP